MSKGVRSERRAVFTRLDIQVRSVKGKHRNRRLKIFSVHTHILDTNTPANSQSLNGIQYSWKSRQLFRRRRRV